MITIISVNVIVALEILTMSLRSGHGVATFSISISRNGIINSHGFRVGRFTQTPIKYTFCESLRIVDYESVFINIKKLRFSQYSVLFSKVQRFKKRLVIVYYPAICPA